MRNKNVIVTGASRGIGREIATVLAKAGYNIAVNYAVSGKDAEELVAQIKNAGGHAVPLQGDVADPDTAAHLFAETEKAFGSVDIVINNAGIIDIGPLSQTREEVFDRLMAVNVKGSFHMMQYAATHLKEGGKIINFSTSALGPAMPGYAIYNATKAAVEAMTRVLAKELGEKKITVNAVAPGPVATELFFQGKSKELVQRVTSMIPLGRLGEVGDIASIVGFLCSEEADWINGQVIRANGGMA